ncbi:MAG TPA: 3'-5' exonuclease, partial [Rhodothermales bacterium]
ERSGLVAHARIRPLGSSRAGNLLRLVSLVRSLEDRGLHWGQIVTELQALVDGGAYELQEMTLSYGSQDAVRIMNTHQAKGLQARVVILADPCGTGSKKGPDRHVNRVGERPYLSMLIQRSEGDWGTRLLAQPVGWEEDCEEEKRHCAAEDARLLYVAGTRAQNMLVVGVYPEKPDFGNHHPLYPALLEIPELESFAVASPQGDGLPDEPIEVRPVATHVEASAPDRNAQIKSAATQSFRRATVTGEKEAPPSIDDGVPGKGRDFGSIVHVVFEDAVLGRLPADPRPYVDSLRAQADLDPGATTDVLAMLDRFRASDLWREVASAEQVYTEVPVGVLEESDETTPALIRGKIDLIYRVPSGWKIVDYKTDVDAASGQLPLELVHYANQVRRYAEFWRDVTGEAVVGAGLYGTKGAGGVVPIEIDGRS